MEPNGKSDAQEEHLQTGTEMISLNRMVRCGSDRLIRLCNFGSFKVGLLISFCLALPLAFGNAAPRRPLPAEPLEKYDDPPVHIFRLGVSAQGVASFGAFTSYQVNVDTNGNNITGDAANEPSITVDPTNHNLMTIGWRQFDSVNSNFRQAGWGYSENGGVSWTFPGVFEPGVFRSDPVLSANSEGDFFYLSLLASFFDSMFRSLNDGQSWTKLGPATGGDKQWFTIDNTGSSGHGFQYQCWILPATIMMGVNLVVPSTAE